VFKVALTGGIASGKSTVAALLAEAGLPVLDSDTVAREVVAPGRPAWQALRQTFGSEFFAADGTLLRDRLARHVFVHPQARQRLEQVLHPFIAQEIQSRLAAWEAQGQALVVVEIPLLFELGLESTYDAVIVVTTAPAVQRRRLLQRDNRTEAEIQGILAAQMPLAAKAARADFLVENSGDLDDTRQQVKKIVAALRKHLDKRH